MNTGYSIFSENYCSRLKVAAKDPLNNGKYTGADSPFNDAAGADLCNLVALQVEMDNLKEINDGEHSKYEVAVLLFEAFPNLLPIMAAHGPFWERLSHVELFPYMCKQFPNPNTAVILANWFQKGPMSSFLSSLWWSVYMTVDTSEDAADKYRLTKVLFRTQDLRTKTLGTYRIFRHKPATMAILDFIDTNNDLFSKHFEAKERYITKYLNFVGGRCQLASLDQEHFLRLLESQRDKISNI